MTSDDSSGTVDPGKVHTSLPDDTADDAPAPDSGGVEADGIWGPRVFHPFLLKDSDPREGGARAWVDRALITAYFLEHDNKRSQMEEIVAWIDAMTPGQVAEAVRLAANVGLP